MYKARLMEACAASPLAGGLAGFDGKKNTGRVRGAVRESGRRGATEEAGHWQLAICQSISGMMLARGHFLQAREILVHLAQEAGGAAGGGIIGQEAPKAKKLKTRGRKTAAPKAKPRAASVALTNLWFLQASYAYLQATHDESTWEQHLMPVAKRAVLAMVSGRVADGIMGGDGLLSVSGRAGAFRPIGLNALWYNALFILTEQLAHVGDAAEDHFERLGGRFRRSFTKSFWCQQHGCLCDPTEQQGADHGQLVPNPDQLLAVILPFSALAMTRRKQIVETVRDRWLSPWGVLCAPPKPKGKMPAGGAAPYASLMYWAWLAEALVRTNEFAPDSISQARHWLDLIGQLTGQHGQLARYYDSTNGRQLQSDDGTALAQVVRVMAWLETLPA